MKLYVHPMSQNARKALITARHLGIPLETQVVDLMTGQQRQPEFLALNPNGKVPTLVDGDFVLWESNAICQYLASKKPGNSLWPEDERSRADICRWQCWELAHWTPTLFIFFRENMIKKFMGQGDPDRAELEKGEEKFSEIAGMLNNHLAGRDYLVGKDVTLADISIASHLMHAQRGQLPLDGYTNINRWFGRIERLPAWQATQPPGT